ncbi:MAG: hypothetical protein ABEH66_00330 [Halobacteriales archaeon]
MSGEPAAPGGDSTDPRGDGSDDMTLAFSLSAAERLADPGAAFADAEEWTRYRGIVSQAPRAADRFARERDLPQDFFTGTRGRPESLALIREQYATGRHVFVGTGESDRRVADSTGWEYRSIEEAAERAGWELEDPGSGGFLQGILDRFRKG